MGIRPMNKHDICLLTVLAMLWLPSKLFLNNRTASAAEPSAQAPGFASLFRSGRQSVGIAGGYGFALPIGASDRGELADVRFLYLAPRWGIGLSDPLGGNGWYRGNFELVIEGSFLYSFEPNDGMAGGITPLIRYNFLAGDRLIPFVQIGGGILALDFDLRSQADGFNFTVQPGLGIHYFVSERTALTAEWRLHHISNAGIHERNPGINSSLVLFGVTFFLR
jgi:lipid A 3-O-deacylase